MSNISVVISAFNEEKNLPRLLESVKWTDEIVVVDNESSDKTAEIAKSYGAKVFSVPNNLMLNVNKNLGFTKATGKWILNLDADEKVSEELAKEIQAAIKSTEADGYWIPRKNIIFGKWIKHSLWWPDYHLRLFKKGKGKFSCQHVHEYLIVEGKTGYLKSPLTHYNYETISQFLNKLDRVYTENEAEAFLKNGQKLTWTDFIHQPAKDFLKTFFSQKGYKDGLHGLVLSLFQAFYQLVVVAKIWERQKFVIEEPKDLLSSFLKELSKLKKDFSYWEKTALMEESASFLDKIKYRLKRKFNL